jgi:hypothetical protein|tara:strand:- start:200 stop:529 length:330 start_codon:yes stop_codon:yes gene_type:complete
MATTQNLTIEQGTTFQLTVAVSNADGTAKDLSTYTPASQMRRSYYSNTYTAFTAEDDGDGGNITVSLTAAQTAALKAGRYVYDIEAAATAETIKVLKGIITVNPEVTRA